MACKKSELVSVINSYTEARITGDGNLIQLSANLLAGALDTLEFAPEQEPEAPEAPEAAEAPVEEEAPAE